MHTRLDIIVELNAATDLDDLEVRVAAALERCDLKGHFFGHYSPIKPEDMIWVDGRDAEWLELYRKQNYLLRDPINGYLINSKQSFFWQDALSETPLTDENVMMTNLAEDFGQAEGFVVPLSDMEQVFSSFSLYSDRPRAFRRAIEAHNSDIQLIAQCYGAKIRQLKGEAKMDVNLSPREKEILTWAAAGKTNEDIADIMGIAKGTVGTHMTAASGKLGAYSKTQAVARAAYLRLIVV